MFDSKTSASEKHKILYLEPMNGPPIKKEKIPSSRRSSDYRAAKLLYRQRRTLSQAMKDGALIALGILSAGFGLKSFLLPNLFIDGGKPALCFSGI